MRVIHCWPGDTDTGLPLRVQTALLDLLMEGFESEAAARPGWEASGTTLLVLEADDEIEQLSPEAQLQIKFALQYPDDQYELSDGYLLSLVFSNDDEGCYGMVMPT